MRPNRTVYLFGNTLEKFPSSKLPSNQQVLQRLLFCFLHNVEEQKLKESAMKTARELIDIWKLANIPTKDEIEVSKIIIKLFNEYNKLRMNEHLILSEKEHKKAVQQNNERALLKSQNQKERKKQFKSNFNDLFDIASKDVFQKINVQEDIDFYLSQKKRNRPGCISHSIDRSYSMLLDCSLSDIEDMDCN